MAARLKPRFSHLPVAWPFTKRISSSEHLPSHTDSGTDGGVPQRGFQEE